MTAPAVAGWLVAGKRGLTAPLFFVSLVLASFGSSHGTVALWAGASIAMAASGLAGSTRWLGRTGLAACVHAYALVVVSSIFVTGQVYSAAGLYHPLLLVSAFLVVRGLDASAERAVAVGAFLFAGALALWGATDIALLGEGRARALFETPAIFAATLNLPLLLLLATVLATGWSPLAIAAALVATGVFLAESRGGLLGMAAGFGVAVVLALRARIFRPRNMAIALALVVAGWAAAAAVRSIPSTPSPGIPSAEARAESSLSRLELFALSLRAWREHPLAGTGYLTFRYTLEQGRAEVPSYGAASETWFVHNDYLQTLQELGLFGLLALLGLTVLPLVLAWRRLPDLATEQRPAVMACSAALASTAVHALVDFPFYVPVCLLLYGAALGALDRRLGGALSGAVLDGSARRWFPAARVAVLAIVAVILLRPVAAEAAAAWGLRELSRGSGRNAAFWLGAAQRIDPKDWRYHWYAGQFWDMQTMESRKRENAQLAANAYAAGFRANPLEVRNLLGLISVHDRYRDLLQAPATSQQLREWSARAVALAPQHPLVAKGTSK